MGTSASSYSKIDYSKSISMSISMSSRYSFSAKLLASELRLLAA
ncbi:MAG: hypothetical protein ACP5NE_02350 [Candidatus Micrarchaeia archaeon]